MDTITEVLNRMTNEFDACASCTKASLSGMAEPLAQIAVENDGPLFLYRCKSCGAIWVESLRECHVISSKEAEFLFPYWKQKLSDMNGC